MPSTIGYLRVHITLFDHGQFMCQSYLPLGSSYVHNFPIHKIMLGNGKAKVKEDGDTSVVKRQYADRDNVNAVPLFCKSGPLAQFTPAAKATVLLDLAAEESRLLRARVAAQTNNKELVMKSDLFVREEAKRNISNYYNIGIRTLERWSARQKNGETLEPKPKSGRPPVINSPLKKRICEVFNEANGRSINATTNVLKRQRLQMADNSPYRTTYNKKRDLAENEPDRPEIKRTRSSPSMSSVARVIAEGKTWSIKKRPALTAENKQARYKFAKEELQKTDEERNDNIVCIDEAWITLDRSGTGRVVDHPKGPKLRANQRIQKVKSKRHPAKIMVMAVVGRPKLRNKRTASKNEPAIFDSEQNGKIALVRVVEERPFKRNVYETINGVKTLKKDKTKDTKVVSVTIDGERYKHFLTRENGVFDKIRAYFGEDVIVRFQEDGAPGHGYNNRNKRQPTKVHDELVAIAEEKGILVTKQPHNSPETNPLDLGIWNAIQSNVRRIAMVEDPDRKDDGYLESLLWKATKQAWDELEPRTIWNCWMVKDEILKTIRQTRGEAIVSEPHAKIRKRWGTFENDDE